MSDSEQHTIVASADLMTTSRFPAAQRASSVAAVRSAIDAAVLPCRLLVDLGALPRTDGSDATAMPELAAHARAHGIEVVAFGPHVQVESLREARAWADSAIARGAAIRRFGG